MTFALTPLEGFKNSSHLQQRYSISFNILLYLILYLWYPRKQNGVRNFFEVCLCHTVHLNLKGAHGKYLKYKSTFFVMLYQTFSIFTKESRQ